MGRGRASVYQATEEGLDAERNDNNAAQVELGAKEKRTSYPDRLRGRLGRRCSLYSLLYGIR